jgi:pyruvate/2-oxoglutarate dehydrogenase complex dihydrolipoamide dehydrogenase (E3) component
MPANKHILVIGGGPAGIQAALAASGSGRRVTLVSEGPPGGRSAWQTLLPSKMWLNARPVSGQANGSGSIDIGALRERYEKVVGTYQRQLLDDLERAGVELRLGTASFLSPHAIEVMPPEGGYPDQISASNFIVATGAVPYVPPGLRPDGECVLSPHLIWKLQQLPETMIVIGAGGPATEYVDAFSRLGVQITWITGPVGVLSAFPPDAGQFIAGVMRHRGVRIVTGLMAHQIDRHAGGVRVKTADGTIHEAQMAFVAIGLRPDLERLNLSAAGLKVGSSGGLATDPFYRTAVEHIYLVGDAASPLSANISIAQGRLAGWHAAGEPVEPLRLENAVMAIYTDPQIAVVGRMSDHAQTLSKVRLPFSACLRAHLISYTVDAADLGFVELVYDSERRITGGLAVCPEAAEILTPLAIAVSSGMTLDELASVYPAHPTFSELSILAARTVRKGSSL